MGNTELIVAFSGLLLLILTFVTIAYWEEARRFYSECFDRKRKPEERLHCAKSFDSALKRFCRLCVLILICLIATVIPVFVHNKISNYISIALLGICALFLCYYLIKMARGDFSVDYILPKEIEEIIRQEQQEAMAKEIYKKRNGISRFLQRFFHESK